MNFKKKRRLVLASPLFFPTYGGSQLRFLRYLPGLKERDLDIEVLTGTPPVNEVTSAEETQNWDQAAIAEMLPQTEVAGTPVQRIRLPDKKGWRRTAVYNRMLLRYCRDPAHRPDVLQIVGTLRAQSIPTLRKLRRMGIPVLYAVTVAPKKSRKKKWWSLRQHGETRLLQTLDCIVTNNEPLRDFVHELGIDTRVEVIPNGVDLERFRPATDAGEMQPLRTRLGIAADDIVITTVGAVTPRKGTDILIEAWAQLAGTHKNLHLVIVGPRKDIEHPGLAGFRQRLEALVAGSGATERVHFTGLCNQVEEYHRVSDIFVLPSEREGMPNSVLEAMASGVPVVVTPFIGLSRDIGEPGTHYLLADREPGALAAPLDTLVRDRTLRVELGSRGRKWVEDTLNLEQSLDRYAALYHELSDRNQTT